MPFKQNVVSGLWFVVILVAGSATVHAQSSERARWDAHARAVTIVRDDHGIAHIHGKTDADAVFGLLYAQAEDDFNRVETNYLISLGRLAEAEGESAVMSDLRMKLFTHPDSLKAQYAASPQWLRTLMDAYADGLNFYLTTHPNVKPRVLTRFEPWMALSFSEGSIGGDIESISLSDLAELYGGPRFRRTGALDNAPKEYVEPGGSNGIAIAPKNTRAGHALLLINPHTSFFFRSEVKVESDQGLNAYGAVTWGQFFVYQGFNDRLGWMHTSSGVDRTDEFFETITPKGNEYTYKYGSEERPVTTWSIDVPFRQQSGTMGSRSFTVHRTHHGPVIRMENGHWVTVALMQRNIEALMQSYMRTKAPNYEAFRNVMGLKANSSNNTIYADADGNIGYFHPQFVPRRNDKFDYTKPVDGSDPASDWKGVHELDETPSVKNPNVGWIANTNNWPYSVSGPDSPKESAFPRYMDVVGENARGVHAILLLQNKHDFTLNSLITTAYDPYLPLFATLVPQVVAAWDAEPATSPRKAGLAEQVKALRGWDFKWGTASVPTSLAVFWAEALWNASSAESRGANMYTPDYMATRTTAEQKLSALSVASARLAADFGSWRTPWGTINRFQRLTGDIAQPFNDRGASIPVPFVSSQWGSLASFASRRVPGTKKYYGTSGNSFVAGVEFGPRVRARAVSAGGESGDPKSKHFNDQAMRYATGNLREVYFYADQLKGHTEGTYHPGAVRR